LHLEAEIFEASDEPLRELVTVPAFEVV